MAIIQGNAKSKSLAGMDAYLIEQSLRFNDDSSAYLSWTPSSAGTGAGKTWTFSGWVKRGNITSDQMFFSEADCYMRFGNGTYDYLFINMRGQGSTNYFFRTSQLFRDTSSWYHIVLSVDTTQATASNRVKLYVNGEQITSFDTYEQYPPQNYDTGVGQQYLHTVGSFSGGLYSFDGYLTETHFIDGQALDPTHFGEFDSTYGHWKPIAYEGTYGTNGFYLPYKQDYSVEGMSTTLWRGSTSNQYIGGVGFSPDLVWTKSRSDAYGHYIYDSVRGATVRLETNSTNAEGTNNTLTSFENDGFTSTYIDSNMVTWSWDMGTGAEELVTNGTFDTDYTGWTASSGATLSIDSSRLKVAQTTSDGVFAYQTLTGLDTNATYVVSNTLVDGDSQVLIEETLGAIDTSVYYASAGQNTSGGTFTPTATTMYLELRNGTSGDNTSSRFDNISIKKVNNTDGSIGAVVKANPTYGQSIVSYTGNGTDGATIGHGLSSTPELIITKNRDWSDASWAVGHTDVTIGTDKKIYLDSTAAVSGTGQERYNSVNSSVFNIVSHREINGSAEKFISYCFHSVAGYSKIGSYTGTGSSGNTVTTGFKPAWVMIKRTDSTGGWEILDSLRNNINGQIDGWLAADSSGAESTSDNRVTFTDTGFTLEGSFSYNNASGGSYIYMAFADTREYGFWLDDSGNNNDFTINNLTESDVSLDSPSNNFATLNPLDSNSGHTLLEGSLRVIGNSSSSQRQTKATLAQNSGKWYWEVYQYSGTNRYNGIGTENTSLSSLGTGSIVYNQVGGIYLNGSQVQSGLATNAVGDVIGVALDLDSGTITWYKNNTVVNSGGYSFTVGSDYWHPMVGVQTSPDAQHYNFGQDSSFAGTRTAQGYTDANGYGDFYYEPPAGYLALCTANMEEPSVVPSEHFDVVAYAGNGSTQDITTTMKPEFTWIKNRVTTDNHQLFDLLRGATESLESNTTAAESTESDMLTSFNSDGFSLGSKGDTNGSGNAIVAWNWKAGGTGVSNTDGTITSTVSANVDAGFSIATYTGNAGGSYGHGLGGVPELIITKKRSGATEWSVWEHNMPSIDYHMRLPSTEAYVNHGNLRTSITSTIVGMESSGYINDTGEDYVAYHFRSIEGYSKIGTYTGNGSTDGTFVYCGFRPKYVMIKRTDSTSEWYIFDIERSTFNYMQEYLKTNKSDAEAIYGNFGLDVLSNGFKLRDTNSEYNASGGTYLFIAFAEMPFSVGGGIAR